MLNGLDLFSGIGGLTVALSQWVRPVAYCENDRYAQSVLLSRMASFDLPTAALWDDVCTLRGDMLPIVDIIYGGFPCQDISVAGRGRGLEGERSGLFFEVVRLIGELRPTLVFLENVPAILSRGGPVVIKALTELGYDCRWKILSASDVGAPHLRKRWWLLAHARCEQKGTIKDLRSEGIKSVGKNTSEFCSSVSNSMCDAGRFQQGRKQRKKWQNTSESFDDGSTQSLADSHSFNERRLPFGKAEKYSKSVCESKHASDSNREWQQQSYGSESEVRRWLGDKSWWESEPDVGRVVNGLPHRMDRVSALGNSVVPQCGKEAFETLLGIRGVR